MSDAAWVAAPAILAAIFLGWQNWGARRDARLEAANIRADAERLRVEASEQAELRRQEAIDARKEVAAQELARQAAAHAVEANKAAVAEVRDAVVKVIPKSKSRKP